MNVSSSQKKILIGTVWFQKDSVWGEYSCSTTFYGSLLPSESCPFFFSERPPIQVIELNSVVQAWFLLSLGTQLGGYFGIAWAHSCISHQLGNSGLSHVLACVYARLLQACLTLCDPVDYSSLGSSVHGILQARILEWVAMPSSMGSSLPRDWTYISYILCIAGGFFTTSATWQAPHVLDQLVIGWPWLGQLGLMVILWGSSTPWWHVYFS